MNKFCVIVGATLVTTLGVSVFTSSTAFALDGNVVDGTSLFAGPSEHYPKVTHLAGGLGVTIHGCLKNRQWCDITWRGERGWIHSSALAYHNGDQHVRLRAGPPPAGLPVVGFDIAKYWDANYQQRLWYDDRAKWEQENISSRQ